MEVEDGEAAGVPVASGSISLEVGDEDGAPGVVSGSEEAIGDGYADDASMAEIKKEGDLRREAEGDGGEQN